MASFRYPQILPSFFFILFLATLLALPERTLSDADTGWHVMAGKWIIENGKVPYENVFSFTAGNFQWLNISWAWDVVAGTADNLLDGLYGPFILTALTSAFLLALVTSHCLNRGALIIATTFTILVGIVPFLVTLTIRPHIITGLLALAFYLICQKQKQLWLLPLLMVLWVNLHGGFLAAFTVLGAFGLQAIFKKDWENFWKLFVAGIFCAIATIINPLGIGVFEGALRTLDGDISKQIMEWKSADNALELLYPILFLALFAKSWRNHSTADWILSLFWCAFALYSVRNLPIFFVLSAHIFALALSDIIQKSEKWMNKESQFQNDFKNETAKKMMFFIATSIAIISTLPVTEKALFGKLNFPTKTPIAEIEYILENHKGKKLLNHYNFGGYVVYLSAGEYKTFIDGRAETAFPPELRKDYIKFAAMDEGSELVPVKYGIDVMLLYKDSETSKELIKQGWNLDYEGEVAVVLTKQ